MENIGFKKLYESESNFNKVFKLLFIFSLQMQYVVSDFLQKVVV